MQMQIDLATAVGPALQLREPFWIASSHFTEKESILDQWAEMAPAALTLKTCTNTNREKPERTIRRKTLDIVPHYGRSYYCDGPKSVELHSYAQTATLLEYANKKLSEHTKVGVSVLATDEEDFEDLKNRCKQAAFFELNLKYSMRSPSLTEPEEFFSSENERWVKTLTTIGRFLNSLRDFPAFMALSRNLTKCHFIGLS